VEQPPASPIALLNRGIAAYHEGDSDEALRLLAQALLIDPESELGWLWFAAVTDDPAEKRYALDRAVSINPDSIGVASRKRMLDVTPVMPNELTDIGAPPLPPELADLELRPRFVPRLPRPGLSRAVAAGTRWVRWRWVVIIALLVALAAAGAFLRQGSQPPERWYLAFAGPLSGPDSRVGIEMANAADLAIARVNEAGGIAGRQIALLRYDDQGNPDTARDVAAEIAADARPLLVLGHRTSAPSIAAGEVYGEAGIPAISGSASADALTVDNPWYFRTIFPNSFEGSLLATYVRDVLGHDTASVITTTRPYEQSLSTAFTTAFSEAGTVKHTWELDRDNRDASMRSIIDALAADPDPGMVVLCLQQEDARVLLPALRRAGLSPPLIGGDALGEDGFAELFADEPEEEDQPGFFTEGIYAAAPMIYDAIGGDALAFARRYQETYGSWPSWQAAKAYDAATMAIHALSAAPLAGDPSAIAADRTAVRDALAAVNGSDVALRGLSGPLFFDETRSVPQAFSVGRFTGRHLTSAPWQYRLHPDPSLDDAAADLESGRAIEVDGWLLRRYPVVDVGIDMNEVRDLDVATESFVADFFLWFLAPEDDPALTDVFFPNATKPRLKLERPLEERTEADGTTYRMYRVQRTFTQPLDFHDYPWDRHILRIVVQNVARQADDVVYVPSPAIIAQPQDVRLRSGSDLALSFNNVSNWEASQVDFVSEATTGRSVQSAEGGNANAYVQFSKFVTEITMQRDVRGFLLKNLLPLGLLALVTYLSLFLAPDQAGARVGFAVTSILTASVLLESVTGPLDVGYTVAIEGIFYVYVALSAALVFINITIERLYKGKRFKAVTRLDTAARVVYPLVCLVTIAFYVTRFGL
jgi:branched-chain amino acid transport system substrate-binding protein